MAECSVISQLIDRSPIDRVLTDRCVKDSMANDSKIKIIGVGVPVFKTKVRNRLRPTD